MKKFRCFLPMLAFLLAALTLANEPGDLYSAVIPVADSSENERNRAVRTGLLEVLVKLTGRRDVTSRPEVKSLAAKATSYAVEFGYVDLENSDGSRQRGLKVQYSRQELDRFLRQSQLPVWPSRRPSLLVWILREPVDGVQAFVNREEDEAIYETLATFFARRGQPVSYPLHDLEDQLALNVEDAWNLKTESIASASARYGADAWLLVRCYETSSQTWRVAWVLANGEQITLDNLDGNSLDETLGIVVDTAVDRIASGYSYVPSSAAGEIVLEVKGIKNFGNYTRLQALLKDMTMVRSVAIDRVEKDSIQLAVAIEGDGRQFLESLALIRQLSIVDSSQSLQPDKQVRVNWLPN